MALQLAVISVMAFALLATEWTPTAVGARMCPQLCSCRNDELIAECPHAQLDMVPYTLPPRLRSLSLRGNHLRQLSGSSFSHYQELRSLELSENQLVDLGRRIFASLRNLELLDLSRNMITGLGNSSLEGLTQLSQLDLSSNYIEAVPAGTFRRLLQLQRLDLSSNLIKSPVDAEAFRGAKKLRVLSLRSNKLSSVPTEALRQVADLALLDLGLNDITELSPEAFLPLRTLEELRLDGCKLETVHSGAFRALDSLRVLKLQDNLLVDPPSASFADIPRLEEIDVGQNPIRQLRVRAFQHLRHLRRLSLSGATEMREIEPNALIDNQLLEQLSLSHNVRLTQLNPATFRPLSKLRRVNLRANGLTSLPVDLLPVAWEELTELDIRDNPLVCNCSLRWLLAKRRSPQNLLLVQPQSPTGATDLGSTANPTVDLSTASTFVNDTTKVKCVAPAHLAGMYLDEVESEESLECSAWPYSVRIGVLRAVVGVLLVLGLLSTTTCCVRNRRKISLPCRRRLSPKGSSPSKQLGGTEWLPNGGTEKVDYLLAQTRLPQTGQQQRERAAAEMASNGVYICQLSSGPQRRPSALPSQPLRFLPQQSLASPDLLDLCRGLPEPPYSVPVAASCYSSVPRQPSGLTVKSTTAPRLPQTTHLRFSSDRDQQQQRNGQQLTPQDPPFCYYFE